MIILEWKVTLSVSVKKINFPKISDQAPLRVQNEHFSEQKRIHSTWYWKGSTVSAGIRTPIHWLLGLGEHSTAELSDLLMNGYKSSVYICIKYQIVCKSIKCAH